MATLKLDPVQQKTFAQLAMQQKTPEYLAKLFNISISSAHNYKERLKNEGYAFPDVRGKRPGVVPGAALMLTPATSNGHDTSDDQVQLSSVIQVQGIDINTHGKQMVIAVEGDTIIIRPACAIAA